MRGKNTSLTKLIFLLLFISFMSTSCASLGKESPQVVESLSEGHQIRAMIYEYVPSRFEAYRGQIFVIKMKEIERRFNRGLLVNSQQGKIPLTHVAKLLKSKAEFEELISLAIERQARVDSLVTNLIRIDEEIYKKHLEYMTSGLSREGRKAIRDSIVKLVEEGTSEYSKLKELEAEKEELEKQLREKLGEVE